MSHSKETLKGFYKIHHPEKYVGDHTRIIFRSSYELKFMKWCDFTPSVVAWGSEEVVIPYLSPVDNHIHRYFVDFYIKVKDRNNKVQKYLIEIKPLKFTKEPPIPKRKTKQFLHEVITWSVNQAKDRKSTRLNSSHT